ncbi:MAG: alkene reductase [Pseudomonadota bacterium]|jgi:N-ethylmaleimide reductase
MTLLFASTQLANLKLKNRVVMSPLTRCRALANTPNALMAKYYEQRSGAGLIITEGTSPSPNGLGYARIPGLFNHSHVEGWKLSTQAIHKHGSHVFVQLMHCGRVGHPLNLPQGARLLAPSAVAAPGNMWTDAQGPQDFPVPREMSENDIKIAIGEYAHACKLAVEAGFDGVELHGANGYLIDQFLNTASNQRKDAWGGSVKHRAHFAIEVVKAAVNAIGHSKVGIRLSPYGVFNGMSPDPAMDELYIHLAQELSALRIAYIHLVDHSSMGAPKVSEELKKNIRKNFRGTLILSGGYDTARAEADLSTEAGDLIAFGRPFISNPNLVEKLKAGMELAVANPDTFYTADEKGYTDYP